MAGTGGKREGSGRKKGGQNKNLLEPLTRVRAKEVWDTGNAPLDIMLGNMMFWHSHSENLKDRILALLDEAQSAKAAGDAEGPDLEKLQQLVKNHLEARLNSQECAKDAAPYVHPRLSSIAIKPAGNTDDVIVIEAQLATPVPNLEEDRSYREGYDNVTPLRRVMPGK
jgi:hypothetical protein